MGQKEVFLPRGGCPPPQSEEKGKEGRDSRAVEKVRKHKEGEGSSWTAGTMLGTGKGAFAFYGKEKNAPCELKGTDVADGHGGKDEQGVGER